MEKQNAKGEKTREVLTFTTSNQKEAEKWCADRAAEGYAVNMEYDKRTGIYTCTAIN